MIRDQKIGRFAGSRGSMGLPWQGARTPVAHQMSESVAACPSPTVVVCEVLSPTIQGKSENNLWTLFT